MTEETYAGEIGGAHWCEGHQRYECTKKNKRGVRCHGSAIRGINACRVHSGYSPAVAKARGEVQITAWTMGGAPDIDYRLTVLAVLQMTYLRLAAYSELLRKQATGDDGSDDQGGPRTDGLIGHRYGAAGRDGVLYEQGEEIRALVALEAAERDRVVRYSKTAHDMGISDRLTSLAERWGDVVAGRITLILDSLELSPAQAALVPDLVSRHLSSIDMDALGGADRGARTNGGRPR